MGISSSFPLWAFLEREVFFNFRLLDLGSSIFGASSFFQLSFARLGIRAFLERAWSLIKKRSFANHEYGSLGMEFGRKISHSLTKERRRLFHLYIFPDRYL